MCMACEEAAMWYRWQLIEQIAKGEMPAGMTEADLRRLELPVPGEIELVEAPDGSVSVREISQPAKASAFVCDSPDVE